jgi:hypothetical protein
MMIATVAVEAKPSVGAVMFATAFLRKWSDYF